MVTKGSATEQQVMTILGTDILPGQKVTLDMQVAYLYTRTKVEIPVVVCRAKKPGPIVLLMAGLHGDEVNGIEVVRRILRDLKARPLQCGTLIAIPVFNVFGFLSMQRSLPDGRDMNRYFPGSKSGSLASRLASALVNDVLPSVDIVVDLHSGGAQRLNHPQVRYTTGDDRSFELCQLFDAPFILRSAVIKGTLRSHLVKVRKPYLLFESGASAQFDELTLDEGVRGVTRVLEHLKLWPEGATTTRGTIELTTSKWIRAHQSGLLRILVKNGTYVTKGTHLGNINNPYGDNLSKFRAPFDGHVLCVNTTPVVNQGDAVFHFGQT